MSKNDILVTGLQPTGPLHLGNYIGAVKNLLRLQDEYDGRCFVFVADYHSMSEDFDPKKKPEQVLTLAAELLALGLDPKKVNLYIQSEVPEVTELCWIFNTITPIAQLERMTQYKDKAARQKANINAGLFDYPVLQSADILVLKGTVVPVGADQVQHVEMTRNIARFFNNKFGKTFGEPKALLTQVPRVMALNDPVKKMSKSLPGSFISLCDDPQTIKKKLRSAVTDLGPQGGVVKHSSTTPQGGGMGPGVKNLMTLLKEFGDPKDVKKTQAEHERGSLKYSELKDMIADRISDHFAEFRKKRAELLKNPAKVRSALEAGGAAGRAMAKKTMEEVRKKTGLRG